jgi:hypothetical protein
LNIFAARVKNEVTGPTRNRTAARVYTSSTL